MDAFTNARFLWEDGDARLRTAPAGQRDALERVTDRVVDELRRRLGGSFTIDELVGLHRQGTDWALALAMDAAPEEPHAWDEQTVVHAAFWRYAREAEDFAGGRRLRDPAGG